MSRDVTRLSARRSFISPSSEHNSSLSRREEKTTLSSGKSSTGVFFFVATAMNERAGRDGAYVGGNEYREKKMNGEWQRGNKLGHFHRDENDIRARRGIYQEAKSECRPPVGVREEGGKEGVEEGARRGKGNGSGNKKVARNVRFGRLTRAANARYNAPAITIRPD